MAAFDAGRVLPRLRVVSSKLDSVPRPQPAHVASPQDDAIPRRDQYVEKYALQHLQALQILILEEPHAALMILRTTERLARTVTQAKQRRDA